MPNNTPGWGAFLPRYNIPETFGTALSYEGQLHWFLENWDQVAEYANALEQPTVTVGSTEFPDTSNALLPSITNSGTDINAVLDFTYPVIRTRFANPLDWDFDTSYDVLTVVRDTYGNSYTSVKAVPAHTALGNTDYWVQTGVYDASLQEIRDSIDRLGLTRVRGYATLADMTSDHTLLSGETCFVAGASDVGDGCYWYITGHASEYDLDGIECANADVYAYSLLDLRKPVSNSVHLHASGYSDELGVSYKCVALLRNEFDFELLKNATVGSVPEYLKSHDGAVFLFNGPLGNMLLSRGTVLGNSDGVSGHDHWYILAFDSSGAPSAIADLAEELTASDMLAQGYWTAFRVWHPVLTDGVAFNPGSIPASDDKTYIFDGHHSRTVFAWDNDYYYVLVVDGQTPRARGLDFNGLVSLCTSLGLRNSVNMDGGGSTQAWINNPPYNLALQNKANGFDDPRESRHVVAYVNAVRRD